ncbi:MAG: NAD-dependent epimerase [Betaproteobacteria bacterium]|nr:NAD-dependent epimerase [Betaproteobacteria bacterium]MDE2056713.1 NAD-dependent epimerase [Betaproteobacteria bacterium]
MKILLTGAAGFIGMHVAQRLLEQGHTVIGVDNLNCYYSVQLKRDRLSRLQAIDHFHFYELSVENREAVEALFKQYSIDQVIHLAAQAGVRYSLEAPYTYVDSNVTGFLTILEMCRFYSVKHLLFASSSSVYGSNQSMPWHEGQGVDHPLSLYAATKRANEAMAHSYSHLFGIPTTGLRFFTVYGPWGRPDMAYFKFVEGIRQGQPITVFNEGQMYRDFTYVDDIVHGLVALLNYPPHASPGATLLNTDPAKSEAPWRILNIGHEQPVLLMDMINTLESLLNKKAVINWQPFQKGDVLSTYASNARLRELIGPLPHTDLQEGLERFVKWYVDWRH